MRNSGINYSHATHSCLTSVRKLRNSDRGNEAKTLLNQLLFILITIIIIPGHFYGINIYFTIDEVQTGSKMSSEKNGVEYSNSVALNN